MLILAGGLGSRYKGQKQVDPIVDGETLMEFALYDALKAGINKFVLIINNQFPVAYLEHLEKVLVQKGAEVHFVKQTLDKWVPEQYLTKLEGRTKPLGTGHAVFCAIEIIQEPFITINADDFYGASSFEKAVEAMENEFSLVAFQLGKTLSENGTVSRGICKSQGGFLQKVEEHTEIIRSADGINGKNSKDEWVKLSEDEFVSMNLWVLSPKFFEMAKRDFHLFLEKISNIEKEEFYLPSILDKGIQNKEIEVKLVQSEETWRGLTYPADKELVAHELKVLKEKGIYPKNLWD